jgi:glycerophosphoryl diester phosphodiesterase
VPLPLVISHRTNMGDSPENSLAGIDAALASGADAVEIDVRCTRDGRVVLLHDETLERTTGDPRRIVDVDYADLAEVRLQPLAPSEGTHPIPTLAEALERVASRALLVVEVKQTDIEDAVATEIRAAGAAGWCWLWAFNPDVATACRATIPEVPVTLNVSARSLERYGLTGGDPVDAAISLAVRGGFAAVSLDHSLVDGDAVLRAKRRGLSVYTWTVNERADIERTWQAGVDAICSDVPELVRATIRGQA